MQQRRAVVGVNQGDVNSGLGRGLRDLMKRRGLLLREGGIVLSRGVVRVETFQGKPR